jgi:hypothetical protein
MDEKDKSKSANVNEVVRKLLVALHMAESVAADFKRRDLQKGLKEQFKRAVKDLLRAAHEAIRLTPSDFRIFDDRLVVEWRGRSESNWHRVAQKHCIERTQELCRVIDRNAKEAVDEEERNLLLGEDEFLEVLLAYAEQAAKNAKVIARKWLDSRLFPRIDIQELFDMLRVEFERDAPRSPYLDLEVDPLNQTITRAGRSIGLKPRQIRLCDALVKANEAGLSVEELATHVWIKNRPDSWRASIDNLSSKLNSEECLFALNVEINKDGRGVWRIKSI